MKEGLGRYKLPFFLFLLNLLLKGLSVDVTDLAHDEPFTVFYAQQSISEIFEMLKSENNPPLYFLLLHVFIKLFGIGTFTVRFPALIFSALTASVIYLIGERGSGRRVGVFAALLFTFSNFHFGFAHEARVYALFGLLTALSMYFFLSMINAPRKTGVFIGLCLVNILLPYAHFFGWLVIGIQVLAMLFKSVRNGIMIKYAISLGAVLLCYIPYLPILFERASLSAGQGTWLSPPDIEEPYNMIWRWSNEPVIAVVFIALLLTAIIWNLIVLKKEQLFIRPIVVVSLLWFLVPFVGMFLISYKVPIYLDRYLIYVSLGFYMLLALSLERFWLRKWSGWAISVSLVLAMAFTFNYYPKDPEHARDIAMEARKMQKDNCLVLISPEWYGYNFAYHYDPETFVDYHNFEDRLRQQDVTLLRSSEQLPDLSQRNSVIYIDAWAELVDPKATVLNALKQEFQNEREIGIESKVRMYLFSREDEDQ